MQNTIVKYVRKSASNRTPIGTLMATKDANGDVRVGWSFCNRRDHFNRVEGRRIAEQRILGRVKGSVPHAVRRDLDDFIDRSQRHFKTQDISVVE